MDSNTRLSAKILVEILEKIQFQRLQPDDIEITMSIFEPILGFSDHGKKIFIFHTFIFFEGTSTKWVKSAKFPIWFEPSETNGVGGFQSVLSILCGRIIDEMVETKSSNGFENIFPYLENLKSDLDNYLNTTE